MLAKKFHLPIQKWMKDKNKKTITKKGNFFIIKVASNNLDFSRFGVIISSKIIKKAVQRNHLKRIIFNLIRLNKFCQVSGKDALIISQPSVSRAGKAEIEKELNSLI